MAAELLRMREISEWRIRRVRTGRHSCITVSAEARAVRAATSSMNGGRAVRAIASKLMLLVTARSCASWPSGTAM